MDETKQPGLKIQHVFLVKAHFEHREDFLALPLSHEVNVEVKIRSGGQVDAEGAAGLFGIVVHSNDELNPVYRFRVEMACLVQVDEDAPNLPVKEYFQEMAPTMMMPFLRETVASITGRGRFGPLYISPINMTQAKISELPTEPPSEAPPSSEAAAPE